MSETVLITRSRSSTDRRIVRGAADALPCPSAIVVASGAAAPSAPGASAEMSALSSPAGISSPASIAAIISPMRSMIASTALTSGPSGTRRPARTSASASSAAWLSASRRGNSKKPQLPLTVWTKRKMKSRRARSSGCASQATISPPRASSISRHSATKSAIRSSIGSCRPQRWFTRTYAGEELTLRYPCRAKLRVR